MICGVDSGGVCSRPNQLGSTPRRTWRSPSRSCAHRSNGLGGSVSKLGSRPRSRGRSGSHWRSPTTTATLLWLLETHSSFGRNIPPMPSYGHAHIARLWASNLARNQNTIANSCAVTAQSSHRQSCPTRKPLRQRTAFPNSTKPAQLSPKDLLRHMSAPNTVRKCWTCPREVDSTKSCQTLQYVHQMNTLQPPEPLQIYSHEH